MRIGFDVDGVLADFNSSFIDRVISVTGRDLFPPRPFDIPCWDYPEFYGYTTEENQAVWQSIVNDKGFWLGLSPYWDAMTILERLRVLSLSHDLYFITSRPGLMAKAQTEVWLATHSGDFMWNPTVLISSDKGACAHALKLDMYIDDRFENCRDVADNTVGCTVYLINRPWNTHYLVYARYSKLYRVESANEMLDAYPPLVLDEKAA